MSKLVPPCSKCGGRSYVYKQRTGGDFKPVACGLCGHRIGVGVHPAILAAAIMIVALAGGAAWFATMA